MSDEINGQVFENYLRLCAPYVFEAEWARYCGKGPARRPPHNPDAAVGELLAKFSAEQLCKAGGDRAWPVTVRTSGRVFAASPPPRRGYPRQAVSGVRRAARRTGGL